MSSQPPTKPSPPASVPPYPYRTPWNSQYPFGYSATNSAMMPPPPAKHNAHVMAAAAAAAARSSLSPSYLLTAAGRGSTNNNMARVAATSSARDKPPHSGPRVASTASARDFDSQPNQQQQPSSKSPAAKKSNAKKTDAPSKNGQPLSVLVTAAAPPFPSPSPIEPQHSFTNLGWYNNYGPQQLPPTPMYSPPPPPDVPIVVQVALLPEVTDQNRSCNLEGEFMSSTVSRSLHKDSTVAEFLKFLLEVSYPECWLLAICQRASNNNNGVVKLCYGNGYETTVVVGNDAAASAEEPVKVGVGISINNREATIGEIAGSWLSGSENIWNHVSGQRGGNVCIYIRTGARNFMIPAMPPEELEKRRRMIRVWPDRENSSFVARMEEIDPSKYPVKRPSQGRAKKGATKTKKTGSAVPKKPVNPRRPVIFYYHDNVARFMEENPDDEYNGRFKKATEEYKALSPEEQEKYKAMATDDKKRYEREMKEWKAKFGDAGGDESTVTNEFDDDDGSKELAAKPSRPVDSATKSPMRRRRTPSKRLLEAQSETNGKRAKKDPEPQSELAAPKKRGPGRPRKNPPVAPPVAPTEKKGPGRPRKNPPVAPDLEPKEKRGPGRPRKSPPVAPALEPKEKRGPGRPRKNPPVAPALEPKEKSSPGRPRKNPPAAPPVAPQEKRGPGRPRKNPPVAPSVAPQERRRRGRPRKDPLPEPQAESGGAVIPGRMVNKRAAKPPPAALKKFEQRFPTGTQIVRSFVADDKKIRDFSGIVESFNENDGWYHVKYEDGDAEDYDEEELEILIELTAAKASAQKKADAAKK